MINTITVNNYSIDRQSHFSVHSPATWKTILCAALVLASPVAANPFYASTHCLPVRDISVAPGLTCPITFGFRSSPKQIIPSFWNSSSPMTRLSRAIREGNIRVAHRLLNEGYKATRVDIKNVIFRGDVEMFKLLCEHGIDLENLGSFTPGFPGYPDKYKTDGHFRLNGMEIFDYLILNFRRHGGLEYHSPLSFASRLSARVTPTSTLYHSYMSIVQCLLEAGARTDSISWVGSNLNSLIDAFPFMTENGQHLISLLINYSSNREEMLNRIKVRKSMQ